MALTSSGRRRCPIHRNAAGVGDDVTLRQPADKAATSSGEISMAVDAAPSGGSCGAEVAQAPEGDVALEHALGAMLNWLMLKGLGCNAAQLATDALLVSHRVPTDPGGFLVLDPSRPARMWQQASPPPDNCMAGVVHGYAAVPQPPHSQGRMPPW